MLRATPLAKPAHPLPFHHPASPRNRSLLLSQPSPTLSSRDFSASSRINVLHQDGKPSAPGKEESKSPNEKRTSYLLELNNRLTELGANRPIRIVILVAFLILGTMESIFWMNVIWRNYFASNEQDEKKDDE